MSNSVTYTRERGTRYAQRGLVVKREGKKTVERAKLNWEDNIKMDFKIVDSQVVNQIKVIQNVETSGGLL